MTCAECSFIGPVHVAQSVDVVLVVLSGRVESICSHPMLLMFVVEVNPDTAVKHRYVRARFDSPADKSA